MIAGIVLAVIGAILAFWADHRMDTGNYSLPEMNSNLSGCELIDLAYYTGVALLIVGTAVAVYVFAKRVIRKTKEENRISQEASQKWICDCGQVNIMQAVYCTHCGKRRAEYNQYPETREWKCACGTTNPGDYTYCSQCGKQKMKK